ncbi:MAG: Na+/H+ antiporter NhaA [Alistipes sp.]|nr:Na+/H+ antiporter NhaA [Candidatus Minthomonas equi]
MAVVINFRKAGKSIFQSFLQSGTAGGIILFVCSVLAILVSNVPSLTHIQEFWNITAGFSFGSFTLEMSLAKWVNEGLMAVFFFMVGLEIKREVMVGELSSPKKAMLPIFAAIGGMLMPALIYAAFNHGLPSANGWGIPMATDIAFAIAVLAILGKRCSLGLKVFLTALAIVDDLGSIVVLAIFYPSHSLEMSYLLYALSAMAVLLSFNLLRWNKPLLFVIGGVVLWYLVLKSGVHSTIAGVMLAITIPSKTKINEASFYTAAERLVSRFKSASKGGADVFTNSEQVTVLHSLNSKVDDANPLMSRFEVTLHPWVYFLIMPVFALVNAGVEFGDGVWRSEFAPQIAGGIFFGLVVGKPVGIFFFSWLACRIGIAKLPSGVKWMELFSIGMVGGIGFTMSLFIDNLAFTDTAMIDAGKAAIIITSVAAAFLGYVAVFISGRKRTSITKSK